MTREEAIEIIKQDIPCEHDTDLIEALEMAIKALERESKKYEMERHCDCCGVLLTEENNKCGYELCDRCNDRLEKKYGKKEQE